MVTPHNGVLKITPIIDGPKCYYRITQLINGGQVPCPEPRVHMPGVSDKQLVQIYSADSTNVQVTMEATDLEKGMGGCEGSVTQSIVVHDDPKLPLVVR